MPNDKLTDQDLTRIRDSLGSKVNSGQLSIEEASRIYDKFWFSAKHSVLNDNPFKVSSSKR